MEDSQDTEVIQPARSESLTLKIHVPERQSKHNTYASLRHHTISDQLVGVYHSFCYRIPLKRINSQNMIIALSQTISKIH